MATYRELLPVQSYLSQAVDSIDYADSYARLLPVGPPVSILSVARAFFSAAPWWVVWLMAVRDRIVGLFGLETNASARTGEQLPERFDGVIGERVGLFEVFSRTADELVLGKDDKHLNFRLSLLLEAAAGGRQALRITTVVYFNNWYGRLYFLPVRPLHRLIVPVMLRRLVKVVGRR